jgi:hypothetical protein
MIVRAVVGLIIAGVLLWGAMQLPLDPTIKVIIRVVVIIALVFWLLSAFGLWHGALP